MAKVNVLKIITFMLIFGMELRWCLIGLGKQTIDRYTFETFLINTLNTLYKNQ